MKKVLVINGHQYYPFSEGKLTKTFIDKAVSMFEGEEFEVKMTNAQEAYDVEEEVEKFLWADVVFLQTPLNWMGVTWSFKKYMDDVFTAGMMGKLSNGDGRKEEAPKKNYGLGGLLDGKYMISVSANAPKEAFNNKSETFFDGISEDDLLLPMHLNFKWFGLKPLKTFFSYDVMKNPEIDNDLARFEQHIQQEFISKI
ncbi:NAD(P)H-dependent oxidoreductase [Flammeovirga yaeyamensis]|uniref:NAD(P)H-dependent oxidoreductase n=1 Tax=Flammeovirga yaeyamensis TaxID=367791 RepID=A0AAX1N4W2_9BACT|nr:NAD(P)H-dependent oxidoreductase [Flammeovirga yaeyamensis]MBB3698203.1 modulator of drug activity B [Flammeovirga yaeyamensis]NMF34442.1 NAD(P)H-dependent oxidoreductase [Flammeovirga yaeyamensis]QWG01421.1 NAD(P)H-dependent oxidoreductase [Flammeovirga yaeyamensis]